VIVAGLCFSSTNNSIFVIPIFIQAPVLYWIFLSCILQIPVILLISLGATSQKLSCSELLSYPFHIHICTILYYVYTALVTNLGR
jgi:hypothetical protein